MPKPASVMLRVDAHFARQLKREAKRARVSVVEWTRQLRDYRKDVASTVPVVHMGQPFRVMESPHA